jgi:hypothetical protein
LGDVVMPLARMALTCSCSWEPKWYILVSIIQGIHLLPELCKHVHLRLSRLFACAQALPRAFLSCWGHTAQI